jgi:hypothetical protein
MVSSSVKGAETRFDALTQSPKQKKVFLGWMLLLPGCGPSRFPSLDCKSQNFVFQCARLDVEKLQQRRSVFSARFYCKHLSAVLLEEACLLDIR